MKLVRDLALTYFALFFALLAVFLYALIFQATKLSPLTDASSSEWARLVPTLIAVSGIGALVLAIPAALWEAVVPEGRWRRAALVGLLVAISFAGFLLAIENFSYTLAKYGLKSDASVLPKIGFGLLALFLAFLWQRGLRAIARRTAGLWPVFGLLIVGSLGYFVYSGFGQPRVPALVKIKPDVPPYNVLILSTDGIESNHMSVYGYDRPTTPFLDSIKSELLVFDDAYSNSGNTTGSIASMLTGISPVESHVVYEPDTYHGADAVRSLPAMLRTGGYRATNWAVSYFADSRGQNMLYAFDREQGEDRFDAWWRYLPLGTGATRWLVIDTLTTAAALVEDVFGIREMPNPYAQVNRQWGGLEDKTRLAGILDDVAHEGPFFVSSHFLDTHGTRFHVEHQVFSKGEKQDTDWNDDFFDDSILDFDNRVRQIYERLEQLGKLDQTIVVITSDHGREWDPRKRVPLLIRFPNAKPAGEVTANVQRLDVAPTILDALGYAVPDWMPGMSLADPGAIPADRKLVAVSVKGMNGVVGRGLVHEGWIKNKTSDIGPYHWVDVIYCDRFYRFDVPVHLNQTETIPGSRSACKSDPARDAGVLAAFVSGALGMGPAP